MKVQCEVERDVWRAARVVALENGDTIGGVVTSALKEFLQDRVGPRLKASPVERKQPKEGSKVVGGGLVGVEPSKSITAVSMDKQTEGWCEVIRPTAKCRKCGESFPVADMVTEPKSGKLFCGDCVENMRNNQ